MGQSKGGHETVTADLEIGIVDGVSTVGVGLRRRLVRTSMVTPSAKNLILSGATGASDAYGSNGSKI